MKTLLSLLLSASILVSSVTPSLAQLIPAGRQVVKGVVQGGTEAAAGRTGKQLLEGAVKQGVSVSPSVAAATRFSSAASSVPLVSRIPAASSVASSDLRLAVDRSVQQQLALTGNDIRALVKAGKVEGLSARILTHSNPAFRAGLLRNEFVTLSLKGGATADQIAQAVKFYRSDIVTASDAFAQLPTGDLASVLRVLADKNHSAYPTVLQCHGALADAAALGLLGSKADASALLHFYKQASQSVFKDTAAVIAARGLLRQGAYKELSELAALAKPEGAFWMELSAFAKEQGLPVEINALPAANPAEVPAELSGFLKSGCQPNGLNADVSRQATDAWLALGSIKPAVRPTAVQPVRVSAPALSVELPEVTLAGADLSLSPMSVPAGLGAEPAAETAAAPATQTQLQQKTVQFFAKNTPSSSSTSGMLYSGLPIPEMGKMFKGAASWLRKRFGKSEPVHVSRSAVREEPGLHENTVRAVYREANASSEAFDADDLVGAEGLPDFTQVAESGFKLTLENAQGVESMLRNVDVTIDASIKTDGYNRLVLSKDYIFELRNLNQAPSQMAHFFFEMPNEHGELGRLIQGAGNLTMHRPLRIKLERTPNRRYAFRSFPVFHSEFAPTSYVTADVDVALLPENAGSGRLLLDHRGTLVYQNAQTGQQTPLKSHYVRLPKEDSKYWAPIMQAEGKTPFNLRVHSSLNKTTLLTTAVPSLQIGLGKTTAPELSSRTHLGEATSSMIMLGINNVLPVLMGLVHPLLKRYGEATVSRWGAGFFLGGGMVALGTGLYGMLGDGLMSGLQLGGFITSSVLIALGTNVTRFVQNILISANRGRIVPPDAFQVSPKKTVDGVAPTYNLSYLGRRVKEVLTQKPSETARDGVLFQTASMFKNIGTMAFLCYPWMVNVAAKSLFNVDLGLDFSASYVPYALFSAWTTFKLSRTAYKDAFPMNLGAVENNFKETMSQTIASLQTGSVPEWTADSPAVIAAAKQLKGSIDALTAVEVRHVKTGLPELTARHETEAVNYLAGQLSAAGASAEEAKSAGAALQQAFDALGHRNVNVWNVFRSPKLTPGIIGIALATVHELSVSNGFAFAMHNVVGNGAEANAFTAFALYGSMSAGRVLGNIISRRISGGSMYALSSAFSLAGTGMMVAAGGHIAPLITGAVIASFGVGNFFSQMYEYMTGLYPKYRREIALLINYTMPLAAVMSFPMRWLVGVTGWSSLDLMLAEGALMGSLLLTPGMLANSSLVRAAKYGSRKMVAGVKKLFKRGNNNHPGNLDDAASAQ